MSVSTEHPTPHLPNARPLTDLTFLFPAVGATALGVFLLSGLEHDYLQGILPWQKQLLWGVIGVVVTLPVSRVRVPLLVRFSPVLYGVNLSLLVLVFLIGTEKGGALSWISMGPVFFQPSEPMKIVIILFLARLLQCERGSTVSFPRFLAAIAAALLPAVLIAAQPDLGSAVIFPPVLLACLYGARVPRSYLVLILSPIWALVVLPGDLLVWTAWGSGVALWILFLAFRGESKRRLVLLFAFQLLLAGFMAQGVKPFWTKVLKPHQRDRIVGFLHRSETDVRKMSPATYHLKQSLIAISSGGLLGQGRGQGMQSKHGFIPMMRTDFIFSVYAEELGFGACLILFGLLSLLLLNGVRCAARAETWSESTVVFGILGMWSAHIFVNLGMTMGLSPIAGIPLPFVSYGGTAILSNYLALGVVLSVARGRVKREETV